MRQSRSVQLYRATLVHTRATKLREKIADVTSVLGYLYAPRRPPEPNL